MKRFLTRSIGTVAALVAFHCSADADGNVVIATASPTGLYYVAGDSICKAVSTNFQTSKMGCSVVASRGSASNVLALNSENRQFGLVQSDVQFHAVEGRGAFAFVGAANEIRSVFAMHSEALTILVKAESPYTGIEDLRGKRLNFGPLGTGTRDTGEDLLDALGWSASDRANLSNLEPNQNSSALCGGNVDAIAYLVGHPSKNIEQVSSTCPTRLLALQPSTIEKLIRNKPYYATVLIPGGLYPGSPAPTPTLGVTATLITLGTVADDAVFNLVKSVFDNLDSLKISAPAFSSLSPDQMIRSGLTAPLHSGAIKYYIQRGWLSPEDAASGRVKTQAGSVPSALRLDEIKNPSSIVVTPEKGAIPPALKSDTTKISPSTSPAPRKRERWELDTSPF